MAKSRKRPLVQAPPSTQRSHADHSSKTKASGRRTRLYLRFSEAHAKLDTRALHLLYAPGATYLPRAGRFDIQTREKILEREKASHDAMRMNGGSIRLSFRVTDRKRFGDVVVDNGYMRSVIRRSKDEPANTSTSKFILVMARQPDGRWALVSDADSDALAEAYDTSSHVRQ